ncbi:MAG: transglutaminase domain-containing protein [Eubacterium sp.]|nr:transglutaminase domain-containing protein [Eubacterium sp.]
MPQASVSGGKRHRVLILITVLLVAASVFVTACGGSDSADSGSGSSTAPSSQDQSSDSTQDSTDKTSGSEDSGAGAGETAAKGSRDNTPSVREPSAPGDDVLENDVSHVDISNSSSGYIAVSYTGENEKVKLRITPEGGTTYTYDLTSDDYEFFPLSSGSGSYTVEVFENISDDRYSTSLSEVVEVKIDDEFGAFLYPNKYCMFNAKSKCVEKGKELAYTASSDLDVVSLVYNFMIDNIVYDYDHAADLEKGYIPDPDTTLSSGKGICLDYASLMAAMLRSQGIPTHLEVGYAGDAYHAWISVYIDDKGWVNGMIEFDGTDWEIMDPTYAANSSESALKSFIGEGDNYTVKYVY